MSPAESMPATKTGSARRAERGSDRSSSGDEDSVLLARSRQGDRAALDLLIERHRLPLYRFAHRLTGDGAEADDLAQEALYRALRGLDRFRGEAAFRTWLLRIASNLWIDRATMADRVRRDHRPVEDVDPGHPADLLESVVGEERRTRLRQAVAALPPRQKATLVLKVYHELTFEEVARMLNCPVGTAKANYHHALTRLRRDLGAREGKGGSP